MAWTEASKRQFDELMRKEAQYMNAEFRAVEAKDFTYVKFAHNMRWKLMDAAVASLKEQEQN